MIATAQAKELLLHPDRWVRAAAANYLNIEHADDPELVLRVVEGAQRWGWGEQARVLARCSELPVSGAAFDAIVAALGAEREPQLRYPLILCITRGPVSRLAHHTETLLAQPYDLDELAGVIEARRQAAKLSGGVLWDRLQSDCDDLDTASEDGENAAAHRRAHAAIEFLTPAGVPDDATVVRLLSDRIDAGDWLEVYLLKLAAKRRLEAAIPQFLARLAIDGDYARDAAIDGLGAVHSTAAVSEILARYPKQPFIDRFCAIEVLGRMHRSEAEDALLSLLEQERNIELRTWLCVSLCELLSVRSVPAVLRQIEEGYHRRAATLTEELLPVLDVHGIAHPHAAQWRIDREQEERRLAAIDADLSEKTLLHSASAPLEHVGPWSDADDYTPPIVRADPKVGRNEPCPCGSGKKYKKCCQRTESAGQLR